MTPLRFRVSDLFTAFVIVLLAAAVREATHWPLRASIIVLVLGSAGILMATAQLLVDLLARDRRERAPANPKFELPTFDALEPAQAVRGSLEIWAWLLGLLASIPVIGLAAALPLFVLAYARLYGASWRLAAVLAALIAAFIFGVYNEIMHVYWPDSLLGDLLFDD